MGAFKKLVMINETRFKTIMHSKRMRTACGSSRLWGGGLPQCMLGYIPPRCGPGDPPWSVPGDPPGSVPGDPLGLGLGTPWVWAWRSLLARPLNFPPGCGPGDLQGMLGYHPQRPAARHAGIPPAMHAGIPPPSSCEQNS